jgi:hypothetical protein
MLEGGSSRDFAIAKGLAYGNPGTFQRLIDLLDEEQDIPILAPVIQREIIYRPLVGDLGTRLRQIAAAGSQSQQIAVP